MYCKFFAKFLFLKLIWVRALEYPHPPHFNPKLKSSYYVAVFTAVANKPIEDSLITAMSGVAKVTV